MWGPTHAYVPTQTRIRSQNTFYKHKIVEFDHVLSSTARANCERHVQAVVMVAKGKSPSILRYTLHFSHCVFVLIIFSLR